MEWKKIYCVIKYKQKDKWLWKGDKMLKISENSVIYVVCPSFFKTGGTELAHQLVREICQQGANAKITYYNNDNKVNEINPAFFCYVQDFVNLEEVVDTEENVIIIPEIRPDLVNKYKKIQQCLWWMSVDNYFKRNGITGFYHSLGLKRTIQHLVKGNIKIGGYPVNKEIIHLYQSEFAHQFLLGKKVKHCYPLSDYINEIYFTSVSGIEREDNVLYNPQKGMEFTEKLISAGSDLNWVPIQNMTTEEVRNLLRKSKVYIDFGSHPGKDRFPREAAISGCCVITGRRGAAAFYEDVPIMDEFKFHDEERNIPEILNKIRKCLECYTEENTKFMQYREMILGEHEQFRNDVKKILAMEK